MVIVREYKLSKNNFHFDNESDVYVGKIVLKDETPCIVKCMKDGNETFLHDIRIDKSIVYILVPEPENVDITMYF